MKILNNYLKLIGFKWMKNKGKRKKVNYQFDVLKRGEERGGGKKENFLFFLESIT